MINSSITAKEIQTHPLLIMVYPIGKKNAKMETRIEKKHKLQIKTEEGGLQLSSQRQRDLLSLD